MARPGEERLDGLKEKERRILRLPAVKKCSCMSHSRWDGTVPLGFFDICFFFGFGRVAFRDSDREKDMAASVIVVVY